MQVATLRSICVARSDVRRTARHVPLQRAAVRCCAVPAVQAQAQAQSAVLTRRQGAAALASLALSAAVVAAQAAHAADAPADPLAVPVPQSAVTQKARAPERACCSSRQCARQSALTLTSPSGFAGLL